MKNKELFEIWKLITASVINKKEGIKEPVREVLARIRSTKFQYWKKRNIEKIEAHIKSLFEDIEGLKSNELKELQKNHKLGEKESDELKAAIVAFDKSKELQELMDIESELEVKKVSIEDLPSDLNEIEMELIEWMVE